MSRSPAYFSLIGGAIFSAGAGGNAVAAPVVCAAAPGCAGCGDISVGRAPAGAGSAGADGRVSAPGVDCSGCVACATCELATSELRAESWVSERPEITIPDATIAAASQKSLAALFLSSLGMLFPAKLFAVSTAVGVYRSPGKSGRGYPARKLFLS
jgi:hypothetical protein